MQLTEATLTRREIIAEDTLEIGLVPRKPYSYLPGQYADVQIPMPGTLVHGPESVRSFSFSSAPEEKMLRFTFRRSTSLYKQTIEKLPLGMKIGISQPIGYFGSDFSEHRQKVCIAGGVGIAPFRSLILDILKQDETKITIIAFDHTAERTVYRDFFRGLQKNNNAVIYRSIITTLQKPDRNNDFSQIIEPQFVRADYPIYIAGPSGFVADIQKKLKALHVAEQRFRVEDFGSMSD